MQKRVFAAVLAILSTAGLQGCFGPSNYEECMLERMKGQTSGMLYVADKACKRQFKVPFSIGVAGVKWEFLTGFLTDGEIKILEAPDEYEVTTARFAFSEKKCAGITEADFGKPVSIKFEKGVAKVSAIAVNNMTGARAVEFEARYK